MVGPADTSPYRGSLKHKSRPARGRKGTICPEWTHATQSLGLGSDMVGHDWQQTEAHRLFIDSEEHPVGSGRRFATGRGVAFEAKLTNDGSWHGYPVPWSQVPAELKDRWQDEGRVQARDIRRYLERPKGDIKWALGTDDDD